MMSRSAFWAASLRSSTRRRTITPLTLNSLTAACNQSSNRNPVVSFDEPTVAEGVEALRQRQLVWLVSQAGGRAVKYEQRLTEAFTLSLQETALLCVLMLRGPQTFGELRGRAERIYPFADLAETEAVMQVLMSAEPEPLAMKLPRLPGTKESRFAHLLAGPIEVEAVVAAMEEERGRGASSALVHLETEVQGLRAELAELREAFEAFKAQF